MSEEFVFKLTDGGKTYTRKLFSLEAVACSYAEGDVFFYHGLCTVQLPSPLTPEELREHILVSWIRLQHLAPSVALETGRLSGGSWTYTYTVPETHAAVRGWAERTVVLTTEEESIVTRQITLATRIWRPSSGKPAMELHIAPECMKDGRWVIGIHGPHANCDGRIAMVLIVKLLDYLWEGLAHASSDSTSVLIWGEETTRLAASAPVLTGKFNDLMTSLPKMEGGPPAPPPGFIPFLPPPVENNTGKGVSISQRIVFDVDKTAKLKTLCKSHGVTVTQFVDSVLAVSHVEAALGTAKILSKQRLDMVVDLYEKATNWLVPLTMKDQRPFLPGYTSLSPPNGTVLFAVDAFSLALDMAKIRKALAFDGENCIRDGGLFWTEVVGNYLDVIKGIKFGHEEYVTRQAAFQASLAGFDVQNMNIAAFASSSIGDFDQLGYFRGLMPSSGALAVTEVLHTVSGNIPIMAGMYWQHDNKFTVYFHSGVSYYTERDMDILASAFTEWINLLLS